MFLTSVFGSQVDHNFIWVVSQISLLLQFEITQKKLHLKHFTIAKPLFYLELRGKIFRLPGKLCQTGGSSRKCYFWAFLIPFCVYCILKPFVTIVVLFWKWQKYKTKKSQIQELILCNLVTTIDIDTKQTTFLSSPWKITSVDDVISWIFVKN